jgi:hypothetical protein
MPRVELARIMMWNGGRGNIMGYDYELSKRTEENLGLKHGGKRECLNSFLFHHSVRSGAGCWIPFNRYDASIVLFHSCFSLRSMIPLSFALFLFASFEMTARGLEFLANITHSPSCDVLSIL